MSIALVRNRIAIRVIEEDKELASGLVLVDSASLNSTTVRAEVVAVGPGAIVDGARVPIDVSVGDIVIAPRYGGTEVDVKGDELVVMFDSDVLAVEVS